MTMIRRPMPTVPALNWTHYANGHYEAPCGTEGKYVVRCDRMRWEVIAVNKYGHEFPVHDGDDLTSAADAKDAAAQDAYAHVLIRTIYDSGAVNGWEVDYSPMVGSLSILNPANDEDCIYATPFWFDDDAEAIEETMIAMRHVCGNGRDERDLISDPIDTKVRWTGNLTEDVQAWRDAMEKLTKDLPVLK
jgi:hypothetical protein